MLSHLSADAKPHADGDDADWPQRSDPTARPAAARLSSPKSGASRYSVEHLRAFANRLERYDAIKREGSR
jgi:hypothetical protein